MKFDSSISVQMRVVCMVCAVCGLTFRISSIVIAQIDRLCYQLLLTPISLNYPCCEIHVGGDGIMSSSRFPVACLSGNRGTQSLLVLISHGITIACASSRFQMD